jgi:hypothetical protein
MRRVGRSAQRETPRTPERSRGKGRRGPLVQDIDDVDVTIGAGAADSAQDLPSPHFVRDGGRADHNSSIGREPTHMSDGERCPVSAPSDRFSNTHDVTGNVGACRRM